MCVLSACPPRSCCSPAHLLLLVTWHIPAQRSFHLVLPLLKTFSWSFCCAHTSNPSYSLCCLPFPKGHAPEWGQVCPDLLLAEHCCCWDMLSSRLLPTDSGLYRPTEESMRFWTFMVQPLAAYESSTTFVGFGERCWQFCSMLTLVCAHLSVQSMFLFPYFSPKNKYLFYHHFSQVTRTPLWVLCLLKYKTFRADSSGRNDRINRIAFSFVLSLHPHLFCTVQNRLFQEW